MKILVLADQSQRIRSQINFIKELIKHENEWKIELLVACQSIKDDFLPIESYENVKILYLISPSERLINTKSISKKKKLYNILRTNSLGQIVLFCFQFINMIKSIKVSKKYIFEFKPDILLINGDRRGVSLEQAFLKIATENGIKSISPYTSVISSGLQIRLKNIDEFSINTIFDKIVFKFFKNLIKEVKDKKIVFYDAPSSLVLKLFGVLSKNPWLIGNGLLDYVCIDNLMIFKGY